MAGQSAPRDADAEYQAAHDDTFSHSLAPDIEAVLPPGLDQEEFARALDELAAAVGKEAVFTGASLKEYVDPYDIPESGQKRTVPSAAVW